MLKRQRPSTPPPSFAETSSFSEFVDDGMVESLHNAKRRRVVAPSLDGRQRGMNAEADENGEGYNEEEGAHEQSLNLASQPQLESGWEEQAGQYKYTNTLLHQLHLEHQRRIHAQALLSSTTSRGYLSPSDYLYNQRSQSSKISVHVDSSVQFQNEMYAPPIAPIGQGCISDMMAESLRVREVYEGRNRQLGTLVRQRLREQDPNMN